MISCVLLDRKSHGEIDELYEAVKMVDSMNWNDTSSKDLKWTNTGRSAERELKVKKRKMKDKEEGDKTGSDDKDDGSMEVAVKVTLEGAASTSVIRKVLKDTFGTHGNVTETELLKSPVYVHISNRKHRDMFTTMPIVRGTCGSGATLVLSGMNKKGSPFSAWQRLPNYVDHRPQLSRPQPSPQP